MLPPDRGRMVSLAATGAALGTAAGVCFQPGQYRGRVRSSFSPGTAG